MVSGTSPQNGSTGYGGSVDACLTERGPGSTSAFAFVDARARHDADPLSRQIVYVAALAGLVALWLCGG